MSAQVEIKKHTMGREENKPAPLEYVELMVPQRYVKRVKTALEERKLLNKKRGIIRSGTATTTRSESDNEVHMIIPTNIPVSVVDSRKPVPPEVTYEFVFETLSLDDIKAEIKLASYSTNPDYSDPSRNSPFLKTVKESLEALPSELLASLGATVDALVSDFPSSYTIYRPMLLLPRNNFTSTYGSPSTKALLFHSPDFTPFWTRIASALGVTHIAINAGIPPKAPALNSSPKTRESITDENILRSPTNLSPIYGDFGPPPSPRTLATPTATDFDSALWVQHTQNGIHQTWAPLYTMFSRGNIREKSRLLTHPSVTTPVAEPRGCTAVDLYAGIGYFVFSYKKAGVSKVLCWELNPWSIEGLQRGAKMNGWRTEVVEHGGGQVQSLSENTDLVVFAHSNEYALEDLAWAQQEMELPPIRHVNCGFLPSSKLSWRNAVSLLDRELGGWIHAHENVGVNDIETRKAEVVAEMEGRLDFAGLRGTVRCEHVERVKTYAPGVLHVVFDICIGAID